MYGHRRAIDCLIQLLARKRISIFPQMLNHSLSLTQTKMWNKHHVWLSTMNLYRRDNNFWATWQEILHGHSTTFWTLYIVILYGPLNASTAVNSSIFVGPSQMRARYTHLFSPSLSSPLFGTWTPSDHTRQSSHPFDHCKMTTLCSQCENNGEISIFFTAELSQLDMICISAEVLTEDSSPENAAICLHL